MKLIFEKSVPGHGQKILPALDVPAYGLPETLKRAERPALPELSETEVSRHYTELAQQVRDMARRIAAGDLILEIYTEE